MDTGSFYKSKERRLHWKIHQIAKERNKLEKKMAECENKIAEFITSKKNLSYVLTTHNDVDGFLSERFSNEVCFYIKTCLDEYKRYQKWKSYKNNLIGNTKERLLGELERAVNHNALYPAHPYIRKLNPKAIVEKNIISIFESTLTRTLGIEKDELSTDIFVIQVYYFDVIKDLILNGFEYNGEKYRFLTASAGQIRTKKTVFIKEKLWEKHQKTLMCGLTLDDINEQGGININKFLAYLALSSSATDEWKSFDIDKCIVVPDFEAPVNGDVDYVDDTTYEIVRQNMDIDIEHTDGCGMILPSLSKKNFMIRCPWIKGLLAVFDFRKFIEVNGCSPVIKDIYGEEHDVIAEDIQIIFTKSQFKLWKYYKNFQEYKDNFKKYNCQAGVCNKEEDKIPMANINYQMLQTLTDITDEELYKVASPSIYRLENMTDSVGNLLNVLGATGNKKHKTSLQQALKIYPEMLSDSFIKHKIKELQKSMVKKYKSGKLDVNGKYLFIVPDLYAACEYWFMHKSRPTGLLRDGEVSCKPFRSKKKLACLRAPHLYREWCIKDNVYDEEIGEWFDTAAVYTSCHDLISKVLQFD